MAKHFPIHPAHPERICWGCDKYCAADSLACSAERTPHLAELFGADWAEVGTGPCGRDAVGQRLPGGNPTASGGCRLAAANQSSDRKPNGLFVTATEMIQPTVASAPIHAARRSAGGTDGRKATTPRPM